MLGDSEPHMRRISSIRELKEFIDHLRHKVANRASPPGFAELDTALEELKVAEEALHEQTQKLGEALERAEEERRRYLDLFELAPDGYGVTDMQGVLIEANLALCELLGAACTGIIGKPLSVYLIPDRRGEFSAFMERVVQDFIHVSHAVRRVWQTEFMLDRDPPLAVSARCSVSRNSQGRIRALWLLRDVTAQRCAEELLKQNERDLEQAVERKTIELRERLNELERFHDVAVSRELRLMELESKIKVLENRLSGGR